jgi:hypothetical protein
MCNLFLFNIYDMVKKKKETQNFSASYFFFHFIHLTGFNLTTTNK